MDGIYEFSSDDSHIKMYNTYIKPTNPPVPLNFVYVPFHSNPSTPMVEQLKQNQNCSSFGVVKARF